MIEKWKDIDGFEGIYQVSNFGNVKSLKRKKIRTDGRIVTIGECILKYRVAKNGYALVCLNKKNYLVHRLVAKSFLVLNKEKKDVNHIDSNRINNNINNLEWVTKSENIQHAIKKNRFRRVYGVNHWNSVKVVQKNKQNEIIKVWDSFSDIKRNLNLDIKSLVYCCQNKIYKTVGGYKWSYLSNNV